MKTYILDTINRIQRFSQKLDIATTLSNKTWVVFNDSGKRELYIFQTDGTVIITNNGIGVQGQWQWIEANKSLIINRDGSVIMLHPQYIDNEILALNLDGTNKTAFLIEEGKQASFAPKTLTQLQNYLINKERQLIDAENQKRIEEERLQIERIQEEEEKELEGQAINMLFTWQSKIESSYSYKWLGISAVVCGIISIFLYLTDVFKANQFGPYLVTFLALLFISIIAYLILYPLTKQRRHKKIDEMINKWIDENPNDPINKYLSLDTVRIQGF